MADHMDSPIKQETIDTVKSLGSYEAGFETDIEMEYAPKGLNEDIIRLISKKKDEPEWMLEKRLEGLKLFNELKMPNFGPSLKDLNFDKIYFYMNQRNNILL